MDTHGPKRWCVYAGISFVLGQPGASAGPGAGDIEWASHVAKGGTSEGAAEIKAKLAHAWEVGDGADHAVLIALITSDTAPNSVREGAFEGVVTRVSSADQAALLARPVRLLAERAFLPRSRVTRTPTPDEVSRGNVDGNTVFRLVTLIDCDPQWAVWLSNNDDVFQMLVWLVTTTQGGGEAHSQVIDVCRRFSIASMARSAACADAILGLDHFETPENVLVDGLGPDAIPRLRERVRQSGRHPETFHWPSAHALARLGDTELRDYFTRLAPEFEASPSSVPGSPDFGRRMAENLRSLVNTIDVEQSPQALLDFIRSDREVLNSRVWAVVRAKERGIDNAAIRQAVLDHAEAIARLRSQGKLPDTKGKPWPGLVVLKYEAMRLGVLSADDLPGVPVPNTNPA